MSLRSKLTLGYVALATLMAALISAVDLVSGIEQQFDSTLQHASIVETVATKLVGEALNRQLTVPVAEALRDRTLAGDLTDLITAGNAILEVAVVDPNNQILADNDSQRVGKYADSFPDFRRLVQQTGWRRKLELLVTRGAQFHQLEKPLGPTGGAPIVYVRVYVAPALIRSAITPAIRGNLNVAALSVAGAVVLTFLFSAVAFRPLGRLRRLLDVVARGEYEPAQTEAQQAGSDELSVMASKVSMLGERLRGAQFEVSDLRGNLDKVLQDLEDAVLVFSREQRLVFASGGVEKYLGRGRGELVGLSLEEVLPPTTTLGLLVEQAMRTQEPLRQRRVPLFPEDGGPGPAIVLLSVDLLEPVPGTRVSTSGVLVRMRDPEAQHKLGRQLQTADRAAAIGKVSSGVAHEVKNPLNAILLHVEVAKAKLARGDTDVAPQMEIIGSEILRLDRVVKTFLDFTRPVELKLALVPLRELLSEIAELARPQAAASSIQVEMDAEAAGGVEVRVDRDLLKQAVLNVVVNAIEAMPEGGELRFAAAATDGVAEIRISDTGHGIAPELREKIFRLYFTTRAKGSGIGLAMTFRIVQLHDGTIDFTSEPGKGTAFIIRLPIAE